MINWMQKHNKYLIPTVWISGLAFVGAGFVGWGAYDMNKDRSSSVAKVGDTPVTIQEFQDKYRSVFSYYNMLTNGKLTQEKADEMKLKDIALYYTIQETLLYNYAKDLGLRVTDKDIENYILKEPEFQKNGVFDKNLYYKVLQSIGTTPKNYEQSLQKLIMINKLNNSLFLPITKKDKELFMAAYYMKDKVSAKIIQVNPNDIKVDETELKSFWNKNKQKYLTKKSYSLQTDFVKPQNKEIDDKTLINFYEKNKDSYRNDKDEILDFKDAKKSVYNDYIANLSKEFALKEYLAIKKNEKKFASEILVNDDNKTFPVNELHNKIEGQLLKPFIYNGGSLIVKIKKINEPRIMTFDEAKTLSMQDFKINKIKELLQANASKELENFTGKDLGYITKMDNKGLENLTKKEYQQFVQTIFNNKKLKGFVILGNKAVIYKVLNQKLLNQEELNKDNQSIINNVLEVKNNLLRQDLIKELEKKYKITQYYKGQKIE